jgi:hypothetical protein
MRQGLSLPASDRLQGPHVPGICFVRLDFNQVMRLCNLPYNFEWNGEEWIGLGNLGDIGEISEAADLEAKGVTLTLSGIPPEVIAMAIGEYYQGKRAQIWYAPLDDDYQLIGTPVRIFFGRIDTMDTEVGETASITLNAESRLVDWARPRSSRYNHEDQIAKYPDDLGFQYVAELVEKELVWGRS